MNNILRFVFLALALLSGSTMAAVKFSDLTGQFSLADSTFSLALDGSTDDGLAANAALATIGTNKTVVIPSGVTLVTCRQIDLPAGTTLIGYGATIKRCDQPTATTDGATITDNTTSSFEVAAYTSFKVGEQIAFSNGTGYTALLTIAQCGTSTAGATCTDPTIQTTSNAQTYTLATGADAASITGGTISAYRAFSTLATDGDNITVKGLEFDGNDANTAARCRWEWCTEMKVIDSFFTMEDAYFHDVPGEAIQESSYTYGDSSTAITRNTTAALVLGTGQAANFAVGDMVFAARDSIFQWADGARIVTAVDTGTETVTVNNAFGGSLSGAGTTRLYKMIDTPIYRRNKFLNIAGNAVHFSASARSLFSGNYIKNGNTSAAAYDVSTGGSGSPRGDGESDTNIGHSYGCVTFSSYTSEAVIEQNYIEDCYTGIGSKGGSNDGILIANNQIRSAELYSISLFATGVTDSTQACGFSSAYSCGGLRRVVVIGNKIFGDWAYNADLSFLKGSIYLRSNANSNGVLFKTATSDTRAQDYGVKDVTIVGNELYKTGVKMSYVQHILFSNNIVDAWPTNDNWNLLNIGYSNSIAINNNTFTGGTYAIDLTQGDSNGDGSGTTISGNIFSRQNAQGIYAQTTAVKNVAITENTFTAPNSTTDTSATYYGINGVPPGSLIARNNFNIDRGAACIISYTSALAYGTNGNESAITGNYCRHGAGTLTDSIVVDADTTGLLVTDNYVWETITDPGSVAVTTPANVVLP